MLCNCEEFPLVPMFRWRWQDFWGKIQPIFYSSSYCFSLLKLCQHRVVLLLLLLGWWWRCPRWGWFHRCERDAVEVGDEGPPAPTERSVQGLAQRTVRKLGLSEDELTVLISTWTLHKWFSNKSLSQMSVWWRHWFQVSKYNWKQHEHLKQIFQQHFPDAVYLQTYIVYIFNIFWIHLTYFKLPIWRNKNVI